MSIVDRREFLELLAALIASNSIASARAAGTHSINPLTAGSYRPGRIKNEYSLFLPGEREALASPPTVGKLVSDGLSATVGNRTEHMGIGDELEGWRLLSIANIKGVLTAIFDKQVTHRGSIAFVTESNGVIANIPKQIGQWQKIRPREINTPDGVKFERVKEMGPDRPGEYILNSIEDPCYENVAALGPEYVGWTLVANEESGPEKALYLDAQGKSREVASRLGLQALWAPDAFDAGPIFNPAELGFSAGSDAFSKRTLLAGFLPVANIGVWDPAEQSGYEILVLLPPGKEAKPMGFLRTTITDSQLADYMKFKDLYPEMFAGVRIAKNGGQIVMERFWNGSEEEFFTALATIWDKWRPVYEDRMQVEIPDEWLLNGARAGITLCRCSYTGLDPTYQIGEGGYTKVPASSHALFPVAHYEFIWVQQLWNQAKEADLYFQHYLDNYILPNGDFLYNTQEQVEAPLNVGVFLANSARSYFYSRDLPGLEKRLPVLKRMISFVLARYEYSRSTYKNDDLRYGLIWGSPEADLGDPHKDTPDAHPFYYQNAVWICRGLQEHAKCLSEAAKDGQRPDLEKEADNYASLAEQMKNDIQTSLKRALDRRSPEMKSAGIFPFTTDDLNLDPSKLESYENHRFMEDWFLADWGDTELDLGHWKHRQLAHRQTLGLPTSFDPSGTSNFMAHGTLSFLIRQEDYRPFLLTLYALGCYTADSGNRYSPEDAYIPGGHPLEGGSGAWSAVVNSTLQMTLGLRWLLCYEENHQDVCHLQKAAPKHWFVKGESISVKNCPTRFGSISWSTKAIGDREWEIALDLPKEFSADLMIHVHPNDGKPLAKTSMGRIDGQKIVLSRGLFDEKSNALSIRVS